MHGRKKSDLPKTKEEKDAIQAKINDYKKVVFSKRVLFHVFLQTSVEVWSVAIQRSDFLPPSIPYIHYFSTCVVLYILCGVSLLSLEPTLVLARVKLRVSSLLEF